MRWNADASFFPNLTLEVIEDYIVCQRSTSEMDNDWAILASVPVERTSLRPYLVVSASSNGVSNVCEAKNVSLLVRNDECVREMRSFNKGPFPPSIYLGRH